MTKTEAKETAQDEMMQALQRTSYYIWDNVQWNEKEKHQILGAYETQFRRVEKTLGYPEYTWEVSA